MTNPQPDDAASPWVERFAPLVRAGGEVLDLACGGGRHARLFAARGCVVEAVDVDAAFAARFAGEPRIRFRAFDLEAEPWPYQPRRFDAIVVTRYLHRALLPVLAGALADGGVLIYETFARGQARYGRPSRPEFLLQPFELAAAFARELHVLAFEDGLLRSPRLARVQRLCALRTDPDSDQRLLLDAGGAPETRV
jgi:SAM-dependent methyltransferase